MRSLAMPKIGCVPLADYRQPATPRAEVLAQHTAPAQAGAARPGAAHPRAFCTNDASRRPQITDGLCMRGIGTGGGTSNRGIRPCIRPSSASNCCQRWCM